MIELTDLCEAGLLLSEDPIFVTVMGLKAFCSLSGLIAVLFIFFSELSNLTRSFHKNARIIIYVHFAMVSISSLGSMLGDGFDLLRLTVIKAINSGEACPVPPLAARVGTPFKLVKIIGTCGIIGTVFAWSLERLCATIYAKSYERKGSRLGVFLCGIAITLSILDLIAHLIKVDFSMSLALVSVTSPAIDTSMKLYYVLAGLEAFGVVLLGCIWIINVRFSHLKARVFTSLAYKSQIQENIEAVSFMFPLAFLHCIFGFTAAIIVPTITLSVKDHIFQAKSIAEFDVIVLYYVVLPMALVWRNYVKRKQSKRIIQMSTHKESADQHFTMLQKLFA